MRVNSARLNSPRLFKWTRFGFNIENGEAEKACDYTTKKLGDFLSIRGFHMHAASAICTPSTYKLAAENLSAFIEGVAKKTKIFPEYVDLGGGFVDENFRLRDKTTGPIPPLKSFITPIIEVLNAKLNNHPQLIIEPGRFLVSKGMMLATRVISVKPRADHAQQITVDATINILSTARLIAHDIYTFRTGRKVATVVYGSSCTARDNLYSGELPFLREGDILLFKDCGAYSISQSSQFIYPRPAVLWIDTEGKIAVARKRETYEDLTRLDLLD